jgi:formamidopyrimidine-DNA glycosylase
MQTASMISKEKCKALHQCIIEVIEKSLEVGCNSSQYPENWIFHSREKKPGKAFVEGLIIFSLVKHVFVMLSIIED